MDGWQKGIWVTAGAALVILTLAAVGTWFLTTGSGSASPLNPFTTLCGIIGLLGVYMFAGAVGDWPLPGRTKARQQRAEVQKMETLKNERLLRIRAQLSELVAAAKVMQADYLTSSLDPPDVSPLLLWSDDARACISNIDRKLLASFDRQRPPGALGIDGCPHERDYIVGLLKARAAFLVQLQSMLALRPSLSDQR